jgi:hypothetical protein
MNKTLKSILIILVVILGVGIIGAGVMYFGKICPPNGPWPTPPWCGGTPAVSARDSMGCFPTSCDQTLVYDKSGTFKQVCEMWNSGKEFWQWKGDCNAWIQNSCIKLCETDKKRQHEIAMQNWEKTVKGNVDWYKEPYTKVFIFGSNLERLEILQPDAHVPGLALVTGQENDFQTFVDYDHFYNMTSIDGVEWNTYHIPDTELGYTNAYLENQIPEELRPAIGRHLDGTISQINYGKRLSNQEKLPIVMHSYNPAFRDYQISLIKKAIDLNADGWYFDNLASNFSPTDTGAGLGSHFDEYTMQTFSKYLNQKFSAEDWKKIGASPDNFNYAEFLRNKGYKNADLTSENKDWTKIPLILEFRRFLSQQYISAFSQISQEAKKYAETKGRNFTISGNMTDVYNYGLEQIADYIGAEFAYISTDGNLSYNTVVPFSKFSMAKGKTIINYIWANDYPIMWDLFDSNPNNYVDVYRLGIMESYAAKSSQSFLRADTGRDVLVGFVSRSKNREDTTKLEQIKTAYDFMRDHKQFFSDFNNTNAKIGFLFFSEQNYLENLQQPNPRQYWDDYELGTNLYRSGIDYDIIAPTMSYDKYSILVLPQLATVDDENSNKIINFVKGGGTLIMFKQPDGLLKSLSSGSLGKGMVQLFGKANSPETTAYIKGIVGSIQTGNVGLSAISYNNEKGDYVVFLFTPNTDLKKNFPEYTNISVKLPFSIEGYKVKYASSENPDFIDLDSGNLVIPSLKLFGMLVLTK